jgi:sporulation protein YlmC with PRC-barrel domain
LTAQIIVFAPVPAIRGGLPSLFSLADRHELFSAAPPATLKTGWAERAASGCVRPRDVVIRGDRQMSVTKRTRLIAIAAPLLLAAAGVAAAQTPPAATPPPPSGTAATPAPMGQEAQKKTETTPPAAPQTAAIKPALTASDLKGLDVFDSAGQEIGKVTKVNQMDGQVKTVEVQSGGLFGYFRKTYIVPVNTLKKDGGRIGLSMTSNQAKQYEQ